MASQINTFKTVTSNITTANATVYTAPVGLTAIILMAQVANITESAQTVTFVHSTDGGVKTELVKNYPILKNDAAGILTGKLIVEQNCFVEISSSANNSLKLTMSVLETTNA